MYGFSYQGATQLLAAAEQPEGLVCIAPHMTAADLYHGWFYHQGALRLSSTLGWGIQMLREDARRKGLREASDRLESAWSNIRAQAQFVPYARHPAIADSGLLCMCGGDWLSHREPDDYWADMDISRRCDHLHSDSLRFTLAGGSIHIAEGTIAGYRALRERAGSKFARDHQYLIVGPWVHIPWGDRAGDAIFGPAANLNSDEVLLRWFNHWLKDSGEFASEPRIRYLAPGPNEWRTADGWPAADYALDLYSRGNANSRKGDGALTTKRSGSLPSLATCLFTIRRSPSRHRAVRRR